MVKTSVIIPSTGRPEQLVSCVNQLLTVSPSVEAICVIECDDLSVNILHDSGLDVSVISRREHKGAVYGWNEGASVATGDALVLAADDCWFHKNWLEEAIKALEHGSVVGFNNFYKPPKHFADHYLVTRDYAKDAWGGVLCCPHYMHICIDIEACVRATMDGEYVYADKAIVEHRHYNYKKSVKKDKTYALSMQAKIKDQKLYYKRRDDNFPVDYEGVF